jgi:hypothetical protein
MDLEDFSKLKQSKHTEGINVFEILEHHIY